MHPFFVNNVDESFINIDNPIIRSGICTGYDYLNNEVFFTFLQDNKSFTLNFNDNTKTFVSRYDYLPSRYISKGNNFLAIHPSSKSIYKQYDGLYNHFFGQYYPSYVVLNVNPEYDVDCVFDNLNFKSECYLNNVDQSDKTLTHIQALSDYQNSSLEPLSVTQQGSGNLAEFANSGGVVASIGNTGIITLADEAYTSSWNGKLEAPTKNAIWDAFGASGGIWQVAAGVITPITANNQLSVTSNTGTSITAFNSGSGGLGFYGFSSAGNGGQFESSSAGAVGVVARNSGGGNIQNWLNTSSQVATISNTGSFSSTPQGTLYGTASGSITSAQLATSLTDETGTGSAVFNSSPSITSPTLVTPNIGNATGGTLSLSGMLTSTQGNNTQIFSSATATTGYQFGRMTNTSGGLLWGIEGSAAGTLLAGGATYAGVLTTTTTKNLELGTDQVKAITIDGTTQDVTIANNITAANLTSGTYTPTLTNGTNVASSTAGTGAYMRVGNQVSGYVDFEATGTADAVSNINISLPIASNFSSTNQLSTTDALPRSGESLSSPTSIQSDSTNDNFYMVMSLTNAGSRKFRFHFQYTVL